MSIIDILNSLTRFFVGILIHILYRIKPINPYRIPASGGVLLTPNHMSFVDGLILYYSVSHRKVRFLVDQEFFTIPIASWCLKAANCIPVSQDKAKDAISRATEALKNGDVICVFPEGTITRIGVLLPFKKGFELILRKAPADTVVIPVCIDKLWGSIFSFKGKKFFWKIPERLPYPVNVLFGEPTAKNITAFDLRQEVSELSSEAFLMRESEFNTLPAQFIETAKRCLFRKAIVDTAQKPLTYLKVLTNTILLSREIKKRCSKEEMVGLMLPTSVAGVISNIAVGLSGNIAVNLNFTADDKTLAKAITKCKIKTILTSRRFIKKIGLNELEQFVYIEDIETSIKPSAKMFVFFSVLLLPATFLKALYYTKDVSHNDIATIVFSSGSTGEPKGVMLSHFNITSNGEMLNQILHPRPYDSILGSLPFFQSFGYTITLWFPLLHNIFTAYVPDPLNAKQVGEMAQKHQSTIMLGTPPFYSIYTRKCKKEQFRHLRLAIAGAERLHQSAADKFLKKFGCPLIEGYGTTEMSPVISCNLPDYEDEEVFQQGTKKESVGLPLPGLSAKIVKVDNYDLELPHSKEGMLLVKGPNRMLGYLQDKEKTDEVLHKGWYVTGDIAKIDEGGFIYILKRQIKRAQETSQTLNPSDHITFISKA